MTTSNLREIWSNTALFEFGLAMSDISATLSKSEFQRRFSKYFRFHPPVLQDPFKRWANNKLN